MHPRRRAAGLDKLLQIYKPGLYGSEEGSGGLASQKRPSTFLASPTYVQTFSTNLDKPLTFDMTDDMT